MYNFLFRDGKTGKAFFVQTETLDKAQEMARDLFANPIFLDIFSDAEAEHAWLDIYIY